MAIQPPRGAHEERRGEGAGDRDRCRSSPRASDRSGSSAPRRPTGTMPAARSRSSPARMRAAGAQHVVGEQHAAAREARQGARVEPHAAAGHGRGDRGGGDGERLVVPELAGEAGRHPVRMAERAGEQRRDGVAERGQAEDDIRLEARRALRRASPPAGRARGRRPGWRSARPPRCRRGRATAEAARCRPASARRSSPRQAAGTGVGGREVLPILHGRILWHFRCTAASAGLFRPRACWGERDGRVRRQ